MNVSTQQVKQRFGIIGNSEGMDRAIRVALQVAPTDMSVLITGESGTGKEVMPQIIHHYSARKHHEYIAVNCGAIPEGTIDSELFGHEKGAFTGAHDSRKGYFEVANGGTIFLDEVAELPLTTQVRLLRVLETGEFIRVGSSKVQKTDVRIIAATNVNMLEAIRKGRFREDLYYRLNTVPISLPPLRERREDIHLLFRKFASDFADKYRMPTIRLDENAAQLLIAYPWPGNIRQLKNITEQISVIEQTRDISAEILNNYLPKQTSVPSVVNENGSKDPDFSEREILYKVLFDMRKDITEMKKVVLELLESSEGNLSVQEKTAIINKLHRDVDGVSESAVEEYYPVITQALQEKTQVYHQNIDEHEEVEESLSLEEHEKELIEKALEKHKGKRKYAALELGISERTLYRKIKEYDLN
ncbi:MAG: sigma-54 interaction domain-containing protein [Flavobacteriales bacterium]